MIEFFINLFNSKKVVCTKMYSNAYMYNLLGQDYDKIMQFALGNGWSYETLTNLHEKINTRIGSEFTQDDKHEIILYKLIGLYKESIRPKIETEIENEIETEHGTSGTV